MIAIIYLIIMGCGGSVVSSPDDRTGASTCQWELDEEFDGFQKAFLLNYLGGVHKDETGLWITATGNDRAHLFHHTNAGWEDIPFGNYRSAYYIKPDDKGDKYIMAIDSLSRYVLLKQSDSQWITIPGPTEAMLLNDFVIKDNSILAVGLDNEDNPQLWKKNSMGWNAVKLPLKSNYRIVKIATKGDQLLIAGNVWDPESGFIDCFLFTGPDWQEQKLPSNCKMLFDLAPVVNSGLAYISAVSDDNQGMLISATGKISFPAYLSTENRGWSFVRMLKNNDLLWLSSIMPQGAEKDTKEPNLTLVAETILHPRDQNKLSIISKQATIPLDLWVAADGTHAHLTTVNELYSCK